MLITLDDEMALRGETSADRALTEVLAEVRSALAASATPAGTSEACR